ncbi:hypothetical protein FisN_14Lh317 [Fistulifera solaris]|uniref:Uncharacterized protein n=1 Tax=Fistulifera solaris TaxID=1519565 RepID=A0A1Z5JI38_FISSO|nr:hypothetical protein FisN_14Lh317 [Fistulifera solaris]|eukprot:GAX13667.1 hypothetical protein FisN_14Lh317 [Fistulifera solaris]
MNSLTRAATTTLPRVRSAVRMQSTMPQAESFQKTWLSDPSTYPIMVILGGAVMGCTAFATNKFATDGNVRVSSKAKGKVIRTW